MKELQVDDCIVLVEDEDFGRVSCHSWYVLLAPNGRKYIKGRKEMKGIYLHREIMQVTDSKLDIDHKDRDGLNCQKTNLRVCTRAQNMANAQKTESKTTSRFKGVSWFRPAKMWRAYIGTKTGRTWLGYFKDEVEAAKAYDLAALVLYGEFARTNL